MSGGIAPPNRPTRFAGFVGGFAVRGPFFGWVVVWIELIAVNLWSRAIPADPGASMVDAGASLIALFLLSLMFAYLLGAIPAAVTGMLCYPLSRLRMSVWWWVVVCAVVGGTVATLGFFAISRSVPLDPIIVPLVLAPGAGAGAGCAYLARRTRGTVPLSRSI